jgi:thymidylate synthase
MMCLRGRYSIKIDLQDCLRTVDTTIVVMKSMVRESKDFWRESKLWRERRSKESKKRASHKK